MKVDVLDPEGGPDSPIGLGDLANGRAKHLLPQNKVPQDVSERQSKFRRTDSIVQRGFGISKSKPIHPPRGVRACR